MIASSIALLLLPKNLPNIICSARFFKPGSSRSYYHLYLSGFDASNRKQITFGTKIQVAPKWLDHNNLAYVELDRPPRSDGSMMGVRHKGRIKVLNLNTNRSKTLIEVEGIDMSGDYDPTSDRFSLNDVDYRVSKTGIHKLGRGSDSYVDHWTEDPVNGLASAVLPSPKSRLRWKFTRKEAQTTWKGLTSGFEYTDIDVTIDSTPYKFHGGSIEEVKPLDVNRLLVITKVEPSRVDSDHFVYEVNCKAKTSKMVLSKIGYVEINTQGQYWIAKQPEARPMVNIPGSGAEWSSYLYSGKLGSTKRWTLFSGLVDAGDYAVRPNRN